MDFGKALIKHSMSQETRSLSKDCKGVSLWTKNQQGKKKKYGSNIGLKQHRKIVFSQYHPSRLDVPVEEDLSDSSGSRISKRRISKISIDDHKAESCTKLRPQVNIRPKTPTLQVLGSFDQQESPSF
jgi:hypothetical protein